MKTLTLLWTFLLAMQSNRSAEFLFCILQPSFPNFRNRPQALTCFHTLVTKELIEQVTPYMVPQSPSSSYLFSHTGGRFCSCLFSMIRNRPQALTCFHTLLKQLMPRNILFQFRNRPQALTCFHTVPVFNVENLCLFKLQNTNLSF